MLADDPGPPFKTSPFTHQGEALPSCPHCHERFRFPPSLHIPKLLPCGHCVCEACLRIIVASTTPFCPVCKEPSPLPDIRHMLTNMSLALVAEGAIASTAASPRALPAVAGGRTPSRRSKGLQRPPGPRHCDDCRKFDPSLKEIAAFMCVTCGDTAKTDASGSPSGAGSPTGWYLCATDIRRHEKLRHTVVAVDMPVELPRDCAEHPGSQLFFFCATCSKLVCRDCVVLDHPSSGGGHDIRDLRTSLLDLRSILDADRTRCMEAENRLRLGIVSVTKAKDCIRAARTQAVMRIDSVFETMMSELRRRQSELKRDLETVCETRLRELQTDGAALVPSIAQLHCNEEVALRGLESDDPLAMAYALESVHVMNRLGKLADGLDCPESLDFLCDELGLKDGIRRFGLVKLSRFDRSRTVVKGQGIKFFVRTFASSVAAPRSVRSNHQSLMTASYTQSQPPNYSMAYSSMASDNRYSGTDAAGPAATLSQGPSASYTYTQSQVMPSVASDAVSGSSALDTVSTGTFLTIAAGDNVFMVCTVDSAGVPVSDYNVEDIVVDIVAKLARSSGYPGSFTGSASYTLDEEVELLEEDKSSSFRGSGSASRRTSQMISESESSPRSSGVSGSGSPRRGHGDEAHSRSSRPSNASSSRSSLGSVTESSAGGAEDKAFDVRPGSRVSEITELSGGNGEASGASTARSDATGFSHSRAPFHRTLSAGPRRPKSSGSSSRPQSAAMPPVFSPVSRGAVPRTSSRAPSSIGSSVTSLSIPVDITATGVGSFEVNYRVDPSIVAEALLVSVSVRGEKLAGSPYTVLPGIGGTHLATLRVPGGYGMCVTPDGKHLLVYAREGTAIVVVRVSDGVVVRQFGSRGSARGQFDTPFGMCITKGNHVLVADCGNNRVQELTLAGEFVRSIGQDRLQDPYGVCAWGDVVAVTEYAAHRVSMFRSDGSFLRCFGSEGTALGQLRFPMGLRFSTDGRTLIVADQGNGRVCVFNVLGGFVRCFGQGIMANPYDVEVMPSGQVLAADLRYDRVCVFTQDDGDFVAEVGGRGEDPGNFCNPSCLAVATSKLFVLDSGSARCQIFL